MDFFHLLSLRRCTDSDPVVGNRERLVDEVSRSDITRDLGSLPCMDEGKENFLNQPGDEGEDTGSMMGQTL